MSIWDFFKTPVLHVVPKKGYTVLVVCVPDEQISGIDTFIHMVKTELTKDWVVGKAIDDFLKKHIWVTEEVDNRVIIKRAETFGMKQANNLGDDKK